MNSTEGYPTPRAIAAAIGRYGDRLVPQHKRPTRRYDDESDVGYRHSVEILPTVRRCKQRGIAQLAMNVRVQSKRKSIKL